MTSRRDVPALGGLAGAGRGARFGIELSASHARDHTLFAFVPALVTVWLLHAELARGVSGVDFRGAYWVAGDRLLHGLDPYRHTGAQAAGGEAFVYPALAALLFVPFALLPASTSSLLFVLVCILAPLATLRVLAVRDWRLYGLAIVSAPVVAGWQTANLTLLLGLCLALMWRLRDRPAAAGLIAALMISLKPFMWPAALWLLATRRLRGALWCLAGAAAVNAVAWGLVGPGEIGSYVHLCSEVTRDLERTGYGLFSLGLRLGIGTPGATALQVAVPAGLALACLRAGRRRHDRAALTLATVLTLAASPLLWNHYLALIVVPLAVARPRLGAAWLVPLALWVCPSDRVATWQSIVFWSGTAALATVLVRAEPVAPEERARAEAAAAAPRADPFSDLLAAG